MNLCINHSVELNHVAPPELYSTGGTRRTLYFLALDTPGGIKQPGGGWEPMGIPHAIHFNCY